MRNNLRAADNYVRVNDTVRKRNHEIHHKIISYVVKSIRVPGTDNIYFFNTLRKGEADLRF